MIKQATKKKEKENKYLKTHVPFRVFKPPYAHARQPSRSLTLAKKRKENN